MKLKSILFVIFLFVINLVFCENKIDIASEYSQEFFQKGMRVFHNTEYELAISYFLKSVGYKEDNKNARYFFCESYRKAGYEENALFVWNSLLAMGYEDRGLKNRVTYLYNKHGMLTDIYVDKDYLLREDIKGFSDSKTLPIFIKPSQITMDKNNHYFIASHLTGTIIELDVNFNVVRNYVSPVPKIENPFGIAIDSDNFLYISDFKNDVVYKMNNLNVVQQKIGFKGSGAGGLLGSKYLLLDDDENLYVSDTGNSRINKYKKNGEILFSFGTEKDGDGDLKSPCGMYFYG